MPEKESALPLVSRLFIGPGDVKLVEDNEITVAGPEVQVLDASLADREVAFSAMLTSLNGKVRGAFVISNTEIRELTASGTHAFKFNPNQPRDNTGRWTDGPGVGEGGFGTLPDQDFSDLKQVGGRAGSNPGGFFESPNGQRFYVKKARSPEHAANEIAASRLYNLAGIPTPLVQSGHGAPDLGGEVQTATQLIPGARADFADKVDVESYRSEVQKGFVIDAWLANWDVAGLEFDNVVSDRYGQPWRVDTGGALSFRAQGAPKGKFFSDQATELDTLRDPGMNRQSEHVFGDITDVEIDAGITKLRRITPAQIDEVISSSGLSQSVADKLKRRREYILNRYDTGDLTAGAFERERDVNAPGGGHNLRNYWVRGEGAAKIGWGTDGSFARCVALLSAHVKNPQGLCAEYHKAATGEWPAEKGVESVTETETFLFRRNQRRDTEGRWTDEPGNDDDGQGGNIPSQKNDGESPQEFRDRVLGSNREYSSAAGAEVADEITREEWDALTQQQRDQILTSVQDTYPDLVTSRRAMSKLARWVDEEQPRRTKSNMASDVITAADSAKKSAFHGTHNQDSHGNWANPLSDAERERYHDLVRIMHQRRLTPEEYEEFDGFDRRHEAEMNRSGQTPDDTDDGPTRRGNEAELRRLQQKAESDEGLSGEEARRLEMLDRIVNNRRPRSIDDDFSVTVVTAADDPKKPYGDVKYADPGYQADGKKRYPIDTEKHIRAAWSYINQSDNAAKYTEDQLRKVKARIRRAMKGIGADVEATAETLVAHTVAAENGECPPGHHMMPDGDCMLDEDMPKDKGKSKSKSTSYEAETVALEERPTTAPWRGVLTVEGIESGDGRMFGANALTWDEPPLPLMWQKTTSHGGNGDESVRVGSIAKVWREPDPGGRSDVYTIRGEGTLDLNNPDGLEVYRRMLEGDMRGNSVDVDSVKGSDVELVYPDAPATVAAEDDSEGDGGPILINAFAQPELTVYKKGRIRASTMVEIPAFTEARLELMDEVLTAAAAEELALELNGEGVAEIERELAEITAAVSTIEISDAPPREWFDEPTDVTPTGALTVTQEGRVYGYIAPAGVRHRSFGHKSVYVPLKNVDYSRFMGGETVVADGGRVTTGAITMGCGHATTEYPVNAAEAKDHYDNTCALVATVRAGENKNGVWIAGALLPDVTPHQVRRMMACRLSGDWRPHMDKSGWRELTAALLVPVPGFPMARSAPSVQVTEGQLVAASVPVQFLPGPTPQERAAAIVRQVRVTQLRSRVASFHGTHNQKSHGNSSPGGSGKSRTGGEFGDGDDSDDSLARVEQRRRDANRRRDTNRAGGDDRLKMTKIDKAMNKLFGGKAGRALVEYVETGKPLSDDPMMMNKFDEFMTSLFGGKEGRELVQKLRNRRESLESDSEAFHGTHNQNHSTRR